MKATASFDGGRSGERRVKGGSDVDNDTLDTMKYRYIF
jgi:hypothetical protein